MRKGWESWGHSTWKWKVQGDLSNICKYPKGGCKEEGIRLFPVLSSDRNRGNGHILKHRRFPLKIRKQFVVLGGQTLTETAQRGGGVSILGEHESHLDLLLDNWLWVALLEQGKSGQPNSRGPFWAQPYCDAVHTIPLLHVFSSLRQRHMNFFNSNWRNREVNCGQDYKLFQFIFFTSQKRSFIPDFDYGGDKYLKYVFLFCFRLAVLHGSIGSIGK